MSQPRQILPGTTYLITRRTMLRHLLLRPDDRMTHLIIYALAVSAARFRLQVHALCTMSTHVHLVVTDTDGVLPRFLQFFHRIVALGTKVLRRWDGPVWDHRHTSLVRLSTDAAVVEKIAYVVANPVAAGLVENPNHWPGAKVRVDQMGGGKLRARRPSFYFKPSNAQWPADATLPITLPPSLATQGRKMFTEMVGAEVARLVAEARGAMGQQGVLGAEHAQAVSPEARATTPEPRGETDPTFAIGRNQSRHVWNAAVATVRAFRASYRNALKDWRGGLRDTIFPSGTWWMRVFHQAEVTPNAVGR